jgi:hypothetical protein
MRTIFFPNFVSLEFCYLSSEGRIFEMGRTRLPVDAKRRSPFRFIEN